MPPPSANPPSSPASMVPRPGGAALRPARPGRVGWILALALLGLLGTAACQGQGGTAAPEAADQGRPGGGIVIEDAWVRPALIGNTTAAYMRIRNEGDQPDRLTNVWVAPARIAQIHETVREGDLVRMVERPAGLEIPAGGEAVLEPGSTHIMIIDLSEDLAAGGSLPMSLTFERAGGLAVDAEVRKPELGADDHGG